MVFKSTKSCRLVYLLVYRFLWTLSVFGLVYDGSV